MQLILLGVFAFLIPSAYGGCHCQFPSGNWKGDAHFLLDGRAIKADLNGTFHLQFKGSFKYYLRADLKKAGTRNEVWHYHVTPKRFRVCKPTCIDFSPSSFYRMPTCVNNHTSVKSKDTATGITVYSITAGHTDYQLFEVKGNDDGTCSPRKVYGRHGGHFTYENIMPDVKRPVSYYKDESKPLPELG